MRDLTTQLYTDCVGEVWGLSVLTADRIIRLARGPLGATRHLAVTWPGLKDDEIKKRYFPWRLLVTRHQSGWPAVSCSARWWLATAALLWLELPLPNDVCANNFQSEREESWVRLYRLQILLSSHNTAISPSSPWLPYWLSDITMLFLGNVLLWRGNYSTGGRGLVNSREPS